ncbi:MAG: HIRAN domain-containing protein [Zoogloeaceae bacterium]|nr:HIRAN domain-containing protein [Zoogloeaceae bacterium]
MRFLPTTCNLFAAFSLAAAACAADNVSIQVQHSPLAGSQYYALTAAWPEIRVGDRLTLIREPENRHDRHAIRVEWRGQKLGYVPRAENRALAAAMDREERASARVSRLRDDRNPWQRVEFEVYLDL